MRSWVELFPVSASLHADAVDHLYYFLLIVSCFFAFLISVLIITFAIRYRRSRHPIPYQVGDAVGLEFAWSAIPFLITIVMFTWASKVYMDGAIPPKGTQDVYGVGKQWMWKLQHPEGRREIDELHVPVNTAIKITLTSQDVIHSFFIPALRIKQDVLPGQYRTLWFNANRPGTYHLFCAEYCGTNHSKMIGSVYVMEENEYEAWLAGSDDIRPVDAGAKLFTQYDCMNCHGTGQRARGPTLGGLYGTYVLLADGRRVLFDEDFIREKLIDPGSARIAGFNPVMPMFRGQLTEEQIIDLIAYIKSLTTAERDSAQPQEKPISPEGR
jgi:cytochrome c oxidase subunit 2